MIPGMNAPDSKARILLIDDEEMILDLGTAMLNDMGYEVTTCSSSLRALEMYRESPEAFDVIITDQTMPDLQGAELAERMRAIREDARVIIASGYANVSMDSKRPNLRMLKKPFTYNQLKSEIETILGGES